MPHADHCSDPSTKHYSSWARRSYQLIITRQDIFSLKYEWHCFSKPIQPLQSVVSSPYLSSRKTANSALLLSLYKSHSSLYFWNDAPIFIPVFSLARSDSLFLNCFSLSAVLFILFDVGSGGAFFISVVVVVCSPPLFTVWTWTYLTR